MLLVAVGLAQAKDWAPRAEALLESLTHQTATIGRDNVESSNSFQKWCQKASPWTHSLQNMLKQQRLETENMQRQAENSIARIDASNVMDENAKIARDRLLSLAKRASHAAQDDSDDTRALEKKARGVLQGEESLVKFAPLVKDIDSKLDEQVKAEKQRNAIQDTFTSHALLTEKAQQVEMQSLKTQFAERQRAVAKYHSDATDLRLIEDVTRTSLKVMEGICSQQKAEAGKMQQVLAHQIGQARSVLSAAPMAAIQADTSDIQASILPNDIQTPIQFLQESHATTARSSGPLTAGTLLNEIDALGTQDTKAELPSQKVRSTPHLMDGCAKMRDASQRALLAQEADLKHTQAREKLAQTNAEVIKQQLAYLHARRKEIDLLLSDLGHVEQPHSYVNDMDTFVQQILASSSDVPAPLNVQFGELVASLDETKRQLSARSLSWEKSLRALHSALGEIDRRAGTAFVHFESRYQEATADTAFLQSMHNFSQEEYDLQKQYVEQLKIACQTTY